MDDLLLKGGVLLAALGERRPTRDIDLQAEHLDIVPDEPYRKYAALAPRVLILTELGMSQTEIARALRTTPRTVRRALA